MQSPIAASVSKGNTVNELACCRRLMLYKAQLMSKMAAVSKCCPAMSVMTECYMVPGISRLMPRWRPF